MIKVILINLLMLVMVVVGCEVVLRNLPEKSGNTTKLMKRSSNMDYRTRSDNPEEVLKLKDGVYNFVHNFETEGVFKTSATVDGGHRWTPVESIEKKEKFLAVFGCSMIFGTAVNDNETAPYYMGEILQEYVPYNYGVPGFSVANAIALVESDRTNIEQSEGLGVFVWHGFHIARVIGTQSEYMASGGRGHDRAAFGSDGKYLGNFRDVYPWKSWIYEKTWNSHVYKKLIYPLIGGRYDSADLKTIVSLGVRLKNSWEKKFPGQRFVWVNWTPEIFETRTRSLEISDGLRRNGVEVLDMYLEPGVSVESLRIKFLSDGHRAPEGNKKFAEILIRELEL